MMMSSDSNTGFEKELKKAYEMLGFAGKITSII